MKQKPQTLEMEDVKLVEEDEKGPYLLKEEILKAIGDLKSGKAEGIDCIPAEMLKRLGDSAMADLIKIVQQSHEKGIWPEDFMKTVIIPLEKPKATECSDF